MVAARQVEDWRLAWQWKDIGSRAPEVRGVGFEAGLGATWVNSSESHESRTQAEFMRLFSRHSSQIFGFILMLTVDRNDAEDVFQDTSVVLWQKFGTYEPGTNFRAWAFRIAHLQVLSHRRKKARRTALNDEALRIVAADAFAESERDLHVRDSLGDCLEKLPERDRRLLEQRYFKQMTAAQIADASSRSVFAIYRTLSRIHGTLLRCMRRAMANS